jgi:hypothetical protein
MKSQSPAQIGRTLDRRRWLRGAGVAMSLPLLDAMIPAVSRAAETPPGKPIRRLVAIQTNMGILPQNFFPAETGRDYNPTPYLELLKEHRDRFTVFSGVSHPDVDGAHEAEKAFLSATPHPGGPGFKSGISLDQFAAEQLGVVTRFASFTLGVNVEATQGMSYSRSGVKVPTERSPASVYRRMFVQGSDAEVDARIEDLRRGRSLLDFVGESRRRLQRELGGADRQRLDQYFQSVRELETQLALAQDWERKPKPTTTTPEPVDEADSRRLVERLRLMLEVSRLAIESDSTRVISLFINTFSIVPEIPGVTEETHSLTHHGGRPEALDQLFRIESAHFVELSRFFGSLAAASETGESLLDRTLILYGTPMGSANSHANTNLPVLLAGGGFKHAGHLAFDTAKNYPLPNLFVSMLQQMGIAADRFASSTGTMRGLDVTAS